MKKVISTAIIASGMLLCGIASAKEIPESGAGAAAQTPLAIKSGGMLKSADGRRIGFIDAVDTAKDGSPIGAQVIVGSRIVHVPASTITATDKSHFTTTLSYKDVEHL